jgi:hypothetical protein
VLCNREATPGRGDVDGQEADEGQGDEEGRAEEGHEGGHGQEEDGEGRQKAAQARREDIGCEARGLDHRDIVGSDESAPRLVAVALLDALIALPSAFAIVAPVVSIGPRSRARSGPAYSGEAADQRGLEAACASASRWPSRNSAQKRARDLTPA